MATKKTAAEDDELANLLDSLDTPSTTTSKPTTSAPHKKLNRVQTAEDMDLDAELAALEASATAPRSATPRISTPVGGKPSTQTSNSRLSTETPRAGASGSGRTSEDNRPRKSGESFQNSYAFTPSASTTSLNEAGQAHVIPIEKPLNIEEEIAAASGSTKQEDQPVPAPAATGGWWGSFVKTAAAAAKQAEAAVKEIQQNEEAKRWTEQVRGNVGALRGLGAFCHSLPSLHPCIIASSHHILIELQVGS